MGRPNSRGDGRRPRSREPLELSIVEVAHGGDGLARPSDGPVVFVPATVPGDVVRACVGVVRGGFRRADPPAEILVAGPGRRPPPCPEAGSCGGCQWQHVETAVQAELVGRLLRAAFRRTAGVDPEALAIDPVREVGPDLGYRQRARLHVDWRRGGHAGFHRRASHVVHVPRACLTLEPELERLRLRLSERLPALPRHLPGVLRAELQVDLPSPTSATARLWIPGRARDGWDLAACAAALAGADPVIGSVEAACVDASARHGSDAVEYRRGVPGEPERWPAWHSPGGFLQPSRSGAAALTAAVVDRVVESAAAPEPRVLELHSGTGAFSVALAEAGARVLAVERDERSVENARRAVRAADVTVESVCASAADVARSRPEPIVVLDPPRTGARDVVEALAASRPRLVVYVSCDAATLARDAAVLVSAGLRPVRATPFLLFPQTAAFETVAVFRRDGT